MADGTDVNRHRDLSSENPEFTPEERDAQLWTGVRRQEGSFATILTAVFVLLTAYFAGLNAYLLYRAIPAPLQLSVEAPAGTSMQGSYALQLIWKPMQRDASPVRPELMIDGVTLSRQYARPPEVELGRVSDVRMIVPSKTTAGLHEGSLVLTKVSGPETLPKSSAVPVSVQVTGGFWQDWFLLKYWGSFSIFAMGGFYLFCTVAYYPPTGSLRVIRSSGNLTQERSVPLKLRPLAYIFPWKRSVIPLAHIWKQAGVNVNAVAGDLQFVITAQPILFVPRVRRGRILKRAMNAPAIAADSFGPAVRMADSIFTCDIDAHHRVEFQYLRPGAVPAAQTHWR